MKKFFTFYKFCIILLLLLFSCRTENLEQIQTNVQNTTNKKISLQQFKNETKISKFSAILKTRTQSAEMLEYKDGKNSDILTSFKIDTTNINRLQFDKQTTYSFRAFNYFESPNKLYNIVYFFKDEKWNFSLLEIANDNSCKPIYDSRLGSISYIPNDASGRSICVQPYTTYTYHCTGTGDCASGICDRCNLCITTSSGTTAYDCSSGNGNNTGGNQGGNDGGGGGGGGIQDPSPYYFDPNQNPDITPEYLRASRAYHFWNNNISPLDYETKYWAVQNSDKYLQILDHYLDNYSVQDNTNNFNFHIWSMKFFLQNQNTTWTQFNRIFLTPKEMNDGGDNFDISKYQNQQTQNLQLPKFSLVNQYYPRDPNNNIYGMPSEQVYKLVGGNMYSQNIIGNPNYANACAIRISRALNYSGQPVPIFYNDAGKQKSEKGSDGKNYILSAEAMLAYMLKTYPAPTYTYTGNNLTSVYNNINGKNGIYIIIPNVRSELGASGHADIFYTNDCLTGGCHLGLPSGGSVYFWELKN